MAKQTPKKMKGVSSVTRKETTYFYAYVQGRKQYFGVGEEGRKSACAAKGKHLASVLESRQIRGGLDIKKWKIASFRELHKWYFSLPDIEGQKSYQRKLSALGHLVDFFRNRPLNSFEADQQSLYRAHRKREGATDGTVNVEVALLGSMFHAAGRNKLIPASVIPGRFETGKGIQVPRRGVTEAEYLRLLEHANPNFADFLRCGYETGMRLDEIRELRVGQVKLDVQHISGEILDYIALGYFGTKTKTPRMIPVSPALKPVLQNRMEGKGPEDYVFENRNHRLYFSGQSVASLMLDTCKRAGVPYGDKVGPDGERVGVTFHSFRHGKITAWVEAGFSDEIIRRASGHHSLGAYRAYVDIRDARPVMNLVRVSDKLDKFGTKPELKLASKSASD